MLRWKIFQSKLICITWFVVMNTLFFLPGSVLPESKWLTSIDFDKVVHIGIFAGLAFLVCSAFGRNRKWNLFLVFLLFLIYGFLVEVIQLEWIANRSFDLFDVAADAIGTIIGLLLFRRVYKKNKPL